MLYFLVVETGKVEIKQAEVGLGHLVELGAGGGSLPVIYLFGVRLLLNGLSFGHLLLKFLFLVEFDGVFELIVLTGQVVHFILKPEDLVVKFGFDIFLLFF